MLKRISKYNIRKLVPMAMLALTPLANSCDKGDDPVKEPYDVTITFGRATYEYMDDLPTIEKHAANEDVRTIYFELVENPDYKNRQWTGVTMENPVNNAIKPAFEAAGGKGRGKGTFTEVDIIEDATKQWLESQGFKVQMVQKNQNQK